MSNNTSSRNFVPMANKYDRVILLVDMDCFYCQVEEKLDPSLKNQPLAVVQYNAWRGGGIIAVNYAARAKGVTRHMRGDEAKEQCPDIKLVKVPNVREKADLSKYRDAGKEVASVLQRFTPLLERASVDEAYLDITEAVNKRLKEMNEGTFVLQPQELVNTYAVGYETIGEFVTSITTSFFTHPLSDNDKSYCNFNENDVPAVRQSNIRLLIGASIASEIRKAVKAETSYECSAGVAHNKILAKLACGINKPNKQTVLPLAEIPKHFETLPIGKIKGLGAKFGEDVCERLKVRYLGQLLKFTEVELQKQFDEKNGTWLYNICRGIDLEAVTPRFYSKSIGCCKKFPGRNNITGLKTLQHWLNELANEINERLEKDICENNRRAKQMVVSFIQEFDGEEVSSSRSAPLQSYDTEMLITTSLEIIKSNTKQFFRSGSQSVLNNPIKFLGISVGKFETISNSRNNIQEMFAQQAAKKQKLKANLANEIQPVIATNRNKFEIQMDQKTNTESNNYSPKKLPNEENVQKSFFFNKLTNTSKAVTDQNFRTAKQLISVTPEKMPKQEESNKIKSFFLNALKKDKPKENTKSLASTECEVEENVNTKSDYNMQTSNITDEQEIIASITLAESSNSSLNNLPSTSFFARALKTQESDQSCNELDELINHINSIPYEEHAVDIAVQNENDNSSSNKVLKSDLETHESNLPKKRKYEKHTESAETTQQDYRSQYMEYAIPELAQGVLLYINCSKCGAQILDEPSAIQTHQDHHFAQELSQQQRHEFRNEVRSKILSSKTSPNGSGKKVKKSNLNNSLRKTSPGITKFLKPAASSTLPLALNGAENQTVESNTITSNVEICDICQLPVKIEDILEHKDFHLAKDLQRKLNQLEVRTVEVAKKPTGSSSRKAVNSSINMSTQSTKSTAKPITQFFTQPNM